MGLTRVLVLALCLAAFGLASPGQSRAEEYRTVENSSAQEVVSGIANKLVRGVTNVATGWMELPKQIYLTAKEEGGVRGATVGPIKGVGMALVRTAAGFGEALTFVLPYPGFYTPYIDPEYVWQKE